MTNAPRPKRVHRAQRKEDEVTDDERHLTDDDLEAQESEFLPDREVMSLLSTSPGGATGGLLGDPLGLGGTGTTSPTDTGTTGSLPDTGTVAPDTSGFTGTVSDLAQHAGDGHGDQPYNSVETENAPPST